MKSLVQQRLGEIHRVDIETPGLFPERYDELVTGPTGRKRQLEASLAQSLLHDPDVLILDEPTEGIQPSIIKDMAKTLKEIRTQRGLSILVSEQVLSFALDVADRILVIEKGKIVLDVPVEEADQETISKYLSV